MDRKMDKRYFILIIPLAVLAIIGMLSGNVYSLGHYKDQGGPGGTVADCNICHNFAGGYYQSPPPGFNLRWVNTTINSRTVNFIRFAGPPANGTLADGPAPYDGPCEVCHTKTNYHTNNGLKQDGSPVPPHFDAQDCTVCHPHFLDDINNYFEPRFIGTQSHITHFDDPKGPQFRLSRPNDYCTYYCHSTSSFTLFKDGQDKSNTTVCNPCHSKDGAFDGVDNFTYGAKPNWTDAIYKPAVPPEPWPSQLKDLKKDWCAGCHDDGTSVVNNVSAPNVMGNNSTFGYNVSGHGRNSLNYVRCDDCHDLTVLHTDGNARTYSAASDNYKVGYRLNTGMAIPRYLQYGQDAFRLCFNCHIYSDVFGPASNFRDDNKAEYLHQVHLDELFRGMIVWDSDWDGVNCGTGACADSAMSCTACHNVHGSKMVIGSTSYPDKPMIRRGELISTPGTQDKVPALDHHWYDANNNPVTDFNSSRWGGLLCGQPQDVSFNHVCWGCHTRGEVKYYRVPGGPEMVTVNNVWTTDWSDNPQTNFPPGAQIRYHVSFTVNGPETYVIKANGTAQNISGSPSWSTTLDVLNQSLAAGNYEWTWDKHVPGTATSGQSAKVTVTVKMKYAGILISQSSRVGLFRVQ